MPAVPSSPLTDAEQSPPPARPPPTITTTAPAALPPSPTPNSRAHSPASTHLAPPGASSSTSSHVPSPLKRKRGSPSPSHDEFVLVDDPFFDEESPAAKASKSASQWNGLLKQARMARGPQWDWGTGMYHVDITSAEYFAGVTRVAESSALPSHLRLDASTSSAPGTPGGSSTPPVVSAGVYDSGRPKRTRAAMTGR